MSLSTIFYCKTPTQASVDNLLALCMRWLWETLYAWGDYGKTFLNYSMIMMTGSYNAMLVHTNSSIIYEFFYILFKFDVMLCGWDKAYILHKFGNILFTNLNGMHVPLFYLLLLKDFRSILLYSWGLGVLVCLYRHLCQVSLEKSKQVRRCLLPLHVK